MLAGEIRAVHCLYNARLRPATSGKRFVRETAHALEVNPAYKLTERQAIYLWKLVYLYRRQMPCDLLAAAETVKQFDVLPSWLLGEPGDHRPPVSRVKPARRGSTPPPPPPQTDADRLAAALQSAAAAIPEPAAEQTELFPDLKHLTAL